MPPTRRGRCFATDLRILAEYPTGGGFAADPYPKSRRLDQRWFRYPKVASPWVGVSIINILSVRVIYLFAKCHHRNKPYFITVIFAQIVNASSNSWSAQISPPRSHLFVLTREAATPIRTRCISSWRMATEY